MVGVYVCIYPLAQIVITVLIKKLIYKELYVKPRHPWLLDSRSFLPLKRFNV